MNDFSECKNKKRFEAVREIVAAFCDKNIFEKCGVVVAGVSGGADSLAMLLMLDMLCKKYETEVICAHFNHKIRGADADNDEKFTKEVCEKIGVKFVSESADVIKYAREKGISTEMAGRELRYVFFEKIASEKSEKNPLIAVAHTKNDRAETVFLNIARGSGTDGLAGIRPVNGKIVRPVWSLTRDDTEFICGYLGYEYRTDKTNGENDYKRNIVRNIILPETEKYFPGFSEKLLSLSEISAAESDFIEKAAADAFERNAEKEKDGRKIVIDREKFAREEKVIMNRIVRKCAENITDGAKFIFPSCCGFDRKNTEKTVEFILKGETGKTIELPQGVKCTNIYGKTVIFYAENEKNEDPVSEESPDICGMLKEGGEIKFRGMLFKISEKENNCLNLKKSKNTAVFDAEKFLKCCENVKTVFRTPESGDIFRPFGGSGEKQLRRYFTDMKIPAEERKNITVLASGKNIIWIPGMRRSDFAAVENSTKSVIIIEYSYFN